MIKKTADQLIKETLEKQKDNPPLRPQIWWPLLILQAVLSFAFIVSIIVLFILITLGAFAVLFKGIVFFGSWIM